MRILTLVTFCLSLSLLIPTPNSGQSLKDEKEVRPGAEEYNFKKMRSQIADRLREFHARPPEERITFREAADHFFCSCACGKILGDCVCEDQGAGKEQRGLLRALLELGMQMKDIESVMGSLYGHELIVGPEEESGLGETSDERSSGGG